MFGKMIKYERRKNQSKEIIKIKGTNDRQGGKYI